MEIYFDHEKLKVYQKAIDFIKWSECIFKNVNRNISVVDQFDRASVSIALNIAEGNGKYTGKDRCRYFDIARGSSLECSSCLDILFSKHFINEEILIEGKTILKEIVSMLIGLIKSNSDRAFDQQVEYNT
ncbi:MAG: four helix bundle protein [Bacteroidota bacterium]|nr:four helix bundle protein [Bacteroidota bacterium]